MKHKTEIDYENLEMILDKLADYSLTNDRYQILIHGQGAQPRSFYNTLRLEKDIDLIWTGWSGSAWTIIFSLIPAQSGLVRLKNKERLKEFFSLIGEQSYCGLYFVDKKSEQEIINVVTKRSKKEISEIIEQSVDSFMVDIYFDHHGGIRDGEVVFKITCAGQSVDTEIINLINLK